MSGGGHRLTVWIINADVIEGLQQLDPNSIDCAIGSPPYWGLRDYNVDGQIGLEPTLGEHIEVLVRVFRELRRVLKPSGTFWLNYGDCYATTVNGRSAADTKAAGTDNRTFRDKPFSTVGPIYSSTHDIFPRGAGARRGGGNNPPGAYLKNKDLCMIPSRLAIALQEDGWWLRSEVTWHKPNPMPESAKDRPHQAHEKVFLLTKSEIYDYDHKAVKVETDAGELRNLRNVWSIPTAPFPGAHFATFPPDLIEPCIKAGCPAGGLVLDPFGGAGTTGLVADRLNRNAVLIELKRDYCTMAAARIQDDDHLFADVRAGSPHREVSA